jgi:hypothetical protein
VEIRPQSETHTAGQQLGPAPIRNQVKAITVKIEALPGGLRISTPTTQGWAAFARNEAQLVAAVRAAFTEAQIAAYAQWRNGTYDLADTVSRDDPDPLVAAAPNEIRRPRPKVRRDQYNPADWVVRSDGRYQSPSGRSYAPDSTMARRIRAAWGKHGVA